MPDTSYQRRLSRSLISASPVALIVAAMMPSIAMAQTAPQASNTVETAEARSENDITVTTTRIVRDGYSAPTPVTVFGEEDIAKAGQINAFQALAQLPSLAGSNSTSTFGTTQSAGTGGLSTLNLRGLGTNRTLTLLDGQRVVGALNIGVTDAGAFPQALVKRVDIVTGGASASYGSDAVAGIVNYVLDHDYVGIKGNINGGVTTYGDDKQYSITLTAGTKFAGGRGHFVISGEYQDNDGVTRGSGGRTWYDGTKVMMRTIATTPAGEPQYIVAPRVVDSRLAPGGVITAGPLRGIAFGPGGAPFNFQYGTLVGVDMSGGTQIGDIADNSNLDASQRRQTVYARVAYDLEDNLTLWGSFNYGGVLTTAHSFPGQYRTGTITIQCGNALNGVGSAPGSGANPFLAPSVNQQCINNGITSFALGSYIADLPDTVAVNERNMQRYAVGLDGGFNLFGRDWKFNGYGAIGKTYTKSQIDNNTLSPLLFAAIDTIRDPVSGTPICRSAAARAAGCVPLNVLGTGVASQAAINWISGTPFIKTWLQQEVAAFNVSGDAFDGWAGPISLAFGIEYRRESFRQESDPFSVGNGGNTLLAAGGNNWFTGNFRSSAGQFNVWEGYLEAVLPLFDSETLGKMELSGAARATKYSQSGYVTTWKAGATWETPLTGLRLRSVVSRDIRAPNLAELFRAPSNLFASFTDPVTQANGIQTYDVNQATVSNLALRPEKSLNFEIGAIYQPEFLRGFSASVDFYSIEITDAISTLAGGIQQVATLCGQGFQDLCASITRDANGKATEIRLTPINLASTKTKGLDLEVSYRTSAPALFGSNNGNLTLRGLATHVINYTNITGLPGTVAVEQSGVNSNAVGVSIPNWRIYATQSYSTDKFSFTVIERYISPGVLANNFIECTTACPVPTANNPTINNNRIAGATYVDIGATFKVTPAIELYGKIDNLFDKDPPLVPYYGVNPYLVRSVNNGLYDLLGRFYRVGVRFKL